MKSKIICCNCRNKEACRLQNKCLTLKVTDEATVVYASDDEKRVYFGGSDTTFEEQYRNHTHNFNHERYSKCREF